MIRLIQWGNYRLAIIAEGNAIVSLDDGVYSLYPEFLNRIDDIVIFDRIKRDDMQQIVDVQLSALARHIEASKNIRLEFADSTKKALATVGYDPAFGARPLKRVIQNRILNALAKKHH
jgi:ATP-dependent Clp protease ATP-binding subunit ClpB